MKFFVTLFSRTVRVKKLKPGTHTLMYCVYHNQGQRPITFGVKSPDWFYNLPSIKILVYRFLRNYVKLKLGKHIDSGLFYCLYQNQGQGHISHGVTSLDSFYNFSININFMSHFSQELYR